MTHTVIAYRPNHEDYCKGCLMGESDSDIEIGIFDTAEEAGEFILKFKKKDWDMRKDREYASWWIDYLIEGRRTWISDMDVDDKQSLATPELEEIREKKENECVSIINQVISAGMTAYKGEHNV